MNDLQGKPWATMAQTQVGSKLKCDGDFTCLREGKVCTVIGSRKGLWVRCSAGRHYLDGQLSTDQTHYVGFYHVGE